MKALRIITLLFVIFLPRAGGAGQAAEPIEIPLYPAPKAYHMGGIPPGMQKESFLAGYGTMKVAPIGEKRTKLEFEFFGLIPNGV